MAILQGGAFPRNVDGTAVESAVRDGSVQRENAGWYAPGQSAGTVCAEYSVGAGASLSVPLLSVPTGKVFLISDAWITYNTTAVQKIQLIAGPSVGAGVPIMRGIIKGDTAPAEMPGIESQPAVLPGQTLWLTSDTCVAATVFDVTISGFQQAMGVG